MHHQLKVSIFEAVAPPTIASGATAGALRVILLYPSWNKRLCSMMMQEEPAPVAAPTIEELCSSLSINAMYLSVRVDDKDDESIDLCTKSVQDGGLEAPSELPCLLLLAHPPYGDVNNNKMRIEHVECRNLEQMLHRRSNDERPSPTASENLQSSLREAWSRLFDAQGNLLPPKPKHSTRIATPTKRIKNNEPAIRIFIAGDKSQVGKSSICMVSRNIYPKKRIPFRILVALPLSQFIY